jgi:hypothetical protein
MEEEVMNKSLLIALISVFAFSGAAQAASDCEAKAVSKDGKPLAGAAKSSFIKKCEKEAGGGAQAACEAKAVSKDGKPLTGAAKNSSVKKCMSEPR